MRDECTVYIVDDDPLLRSWMKREVSKLGLRAETFPSAPCFLSALSAERPGCVVTDVRMEPMDGLELQQRLAEMDVKIPLIMVTAYGDVEMAVRAMRAGAVTFLEKPVQPRLLEEAIRDALSREDRVVRDRQRNGETRAKLQRLTPREREVLDAVLLGHTSREIARQLGISPRTIHFHRAEISRKMEATSLADLIAMVLSAQRAETLPPPDKVTDAE